MSMYHFSASCELLSLRPPLHCLVVKNAQGTKSSTTVLFFTYIYKDIYIDITKANLDSKMSNAMKPNVTMQFVFHKIENENEIVIGALSQTK